MSTINDYIEKCPSFGWQGGPEFNTRIVELANGRERRNAQWSNARHKYTIPFNNITKDEYRAIKQMFYSAKGMNNQFRHIDVLDDTAEDASFGVGDGVRTSFQLMKISEVDGVFYERRVYAIRKGSTPVVMVNGAPATATFDFLRGIVIFASAPPDGSELTWTGEFDVWVRFNQDDLPFTLTDKTPVGEMFITGNVELIEVAPPPFEE